MDDHMIRLKHKVYLRICEKRVEYMKKFKANYTISEVIEILLLEANIYEGK